MSGFHILLMCFGCITNDILKKKEKKHSQCPNIEPTWLVISNLLAIMTSFCSEFFNHHKLPPPFKTVRKVWKHCWLPPPQPFPPPRSSLLADHYFCPGVGGVREGSCVWGALPPHRKNGECKTRMAILFPFARSVAGPRYEIWCWPKAYNGKSYRSFPVETALPDMPQTVHSCDL